jgi:1-acyl-sn-glycerol-3-phosphate acyltransferase
MARASTPKDSGSRRDGASASASRSVNGRSDSSSTSRSTAPRGPEAPTPPRPDQSPGGIQGLIARRAANDSLSGPDRRLWKVQKPFWSLVNDHYFRLDTDGWHRLPEAPALLIGVHSGGALTMDAWTFVFEWYRRFGFKRILHGTAHDVLMATPALGDYFKSNGVISASRKSVGRALEAGHDVIVWPGGEEDSMRSWRKRDQAVLAGRKGFVRMAITSAVPIVPVASIGGSDTAFVITEGRFLTKLIPGVSKALRGATLPIIAGLPFGIAPELLPTHLPLPAKIRTEILDPIEVDHDPERAEDQAYVDSVYHEVHGALQAGMDRLAERRSFPVMG